MRHTMTCYHSDSVSFIRSSVAQCPDADTTGIGFLPLPQPTFLSQNLYFVLNRFSFTDEPTVRYRQVYDDFSYQNRRFMLRGSGRRAADLPPRVLCRSLLF